MDQGVNHMGNYKMLGYEWKERQNIHKLLGFSEGSSQKETYSCKCLCLKK